MYSPVIHIHAIRKRQVHIDMIVATVDDAAKLCAISMVSTIVFPELKAGWTVRGVRLRGSCWPG